MKAILLLCLMNVHVDRKTFKFFFGLLIDNYDFFCLHTVH
jgi:hypothetical protein